jgi:RNA polymerase sigma-70 factor, ECF subfamily
MTGVDPPGTRAHDLEDVFRDHAAGVYRTLYAFTAGRVPIAEEATAEAFARAISHADRIRDPLAWIYRTAFRLAAAELRRERRMMPSSDRAGTDAEGLFPLVEALRRLSPNQRAAIVLRYEADLAVEEIATRMGVSPATVRVHLYRGRARLRLLLGAGESDDV